MSLYINEAGLLSLVVKSQLPTDPDIATQLGISVETRYVRNETEIVGFVQDVLAQMIAPYGSKLMSITSGLTYIYRIKR